jgi:hypothetical protein
MIDKYKIAKAARQISEYVVDAKGFDDSKPTHLAFLDGHVDGFNAGAKWAINEFLKDLWHPASEKPADNEDILVESTFGSTSYELSLGMYYCIDECDEYHGDSWEVQAAKQRVTRWLYVDDILPKE